MRRFKVGLSQIFRNCRHGGKDEGKTMHGPNDLNDASTRGFPMAALKAKLDRRFVLRRLRDICLAGAGVTLAGPVFAAGASRGDASADLQARLDALARRARPGTLGVMVLDLESGRRWRVNADRAYPMMSVFKAPLAAVVLSQIDNGRLSFDHKVTLTRADLRPGASLIARDFKGESMEFTVGDLLGYAVSKSDNTAADALLNLVGGSPAVMRFLKRHGIKGMRIDTGEGEVAHVFSGLGRLAKPPADETPVERQRRLMRGYHAFLTDPRNHSTPGAAVDFLQKLWQRKLLSPRSTQYLLELMYGQTFPKRLVAGLPAGVRLAHKSGTSVTVDGKTAAFNDIGIIAWPDGRSVIVAAFLTASDAAKAVRERIFADLAREIVAALHP
jgi:beta-lactamase class A